MNKVTPLTLRQLQIQRSQRFDLPDRRNDEDRRRYRAIVVARNEAKRQLARINQWRRDVVKHMRESANRNNLPALLRKRAD